MAAYLEEYARIPAAVDAISALPDDADAAAVQAAAERAGHWAGVAVGRAMCRRPALFDRPDVAAAPLVRRARAAGQIQQRINTGELRSIQYGLAEEPSVAVYDLDASKVIRAEPYYEEAPEFWFEAACTECPMLSRYFLVDKHGDIRENLLDEHSAFQHKLLSDADQQRWFLHAAAAVNQYQYIHWVENLVGEGKIQLKCERPDLSGIDVTEDVKEALDSLFA